MATRCGNIDPAIVLQMARADHSVDDIDALLNRRSGLLALSGSKDMRAILAAEAQEDDAARLAIEIFVHRIVMTAGAYFTLLEGRERWYGGGTHSRLTARVWRLRARDVDLDPGLNDGAGPVSGPNTAVYVFRTNEEQLIAREVARMLR
jgi:acetate kinase